MSMAQQQRPSPLQNFRGTVNLGLWLISVWAISLEMFLHRNLGERYVRLHAWLALLLMSAYSLFCVGYDLRPFSCFMLLYLAMWLKNGWENARARRRGEVFHSRYTGWPSAVGPKTKFSERAAKRFVEPIITFAFGWALREGCHEVPVGTFLMIGASCLTLSVRFCEIVDRAQTLDLSDAAIEQQMTAERFREMRNDL